MERSPYTPGAGFMPAYIAGREEMLTQAKSFLEGLKERYPQQSVVYYGLRGVGKTVLLNKIENIANTEGILLYHLEADERGNFTKLLLTNINRILRKISIKENAKTLIGTCISLIKSFKITYNLEDQSFEGGLSDDISLVSGIYTDDLTEIFVELGMAALNTDNTICFFIDEMQYLTKEELKGITMALHRCNQLRLPIMIFCAGLPKILKELGEACSYSERLYKFEEIGALTKAQAAAAIIQPATAQHVEYSEDAVERIIELSGCYPYFIQELCHVVWVAAENSPITKDVVDNVQNDFFVALDRGFFAVRYNRCSNTEKSFMTAMVKCGTLPCTISNVARILGKNVQSISPMRARLISKGMIYSTGYSEIDFTVPQFDNFVKRINPNLEI